MLRFLGLRPSFFVKLNRCSLVFQVYLAHLFTALAFRDFSHKVMHTRDFFPPRTHVIFPRRFSAWFRSSPYSTHGYEISAHAAAPSLLAPPLNHVTPHTLRQGFSGGSTFVPGLVSLLNSSHNPAVRVALQVPHSTLLFVFPRFYSHLPPKRRCCRVLWARAGTHSKARVSTTTKKRCRWSSTKYAVRTPSPTSQPQVAPVEIPAISQPS